MAVGAKATICMGNDFVAARKTAMESGDGPTNNVEDLT